MKTIKKKMNKIFIIFIILNFKSNLLESSSTTLKVKSVKTTMLETGALYKNFNLKEEELYFYNKNTYLIFDKCIELVIGNDTIIFNNDSLIIEEITNDSLRNLYPGDYLFNCSRLDCNISRKLYEMLETKSKKNTII